MQVKATETFYKEVEVHESEIIRCALSMFDRKYKLKGDYINEEGYWMIFDYCHPHNGEDHYKKGALALPEERLLLDIRDMLGNLNANSK